MYKKQQQTHKPIVLKKRKKYLYKLGNHHYQSHPSTFPSIILFEIRKRQCEQKAKRPERNRRAETPHDYSSTRKLHQHARKKERKHKTMIIETSNNAINSAFPSSAAHSESSVGGAAAGSGPSGKAALGALRALRAGWNQHRLCRRRGRPAAWETSQTHAKQPHKSNEHLRHRGNPHPRC